MEWKYYIPHQWDQDRQVWEDVYLVPADSQGCREAIWLTVNTLAHVLDPESGFEESARTKALRDLGDRAFHIDGTDMVVQAENFNREELLDWAWIWLQQNGLAVSDLREASAEQIHGKLPWTSAAERKEKSSASDRLEAKTRYDFSSHPERKIAAELRRLFRAFQANDQRAVILCHNQMCDYIDNWLLNRHLLSEPRWDRRTVDCVSGRVEIRPPNWYRVSGGKVWLWLFENGQFKGGDSTEPVEFELELCPETGELWRYVFRLGDAARFQGSSDANWAFVFREGQERSLFQTAPADRLELTCADEDPEPDIESDSEGSHNRHVDSLAEDIAALTRQFFRDLEARDQSAADMSLLYLKHYLMLMVNVLTGSDPDWRHRQVWQLAGAAPNIEVPIRFRLVDDMVQRRRSEAGQVPCREPFEIELELCPETGFFKKFALRFGCKSIRYCKSRNPSTPDQGE